eukprot:7182107-Alexandrium_andersonii.AAC.2
MRQCPSRNRPHPSGASQTPALPQCPAAQLPAPRPQPATTHCAPRLLQQLSRETLPYEGAFLNSANLPVRTMSKHVVVKWRMGWRHICADALGLISTRPGNNTSPTNNGMVKEECWQ